MRIGHQIRAFEQIKANYDGNIPLHRFLINYYKQHREMGASDRRWATRHIYSFFRLGKALSSLEPIKRLAIADFLCHEQAGLISTSYLPELVSFSNRPLEEKIAQVMQLFAEFNLQEVFPFRAELSNGLNINLFHKSFFQQPLLFIRVQDQHVDRVKHQLSLREIPFKALMDGTLALPNGTKLEQVLEDQKLYQVQDLSSQKTGAYFQPQAGENWWDCCAASGGKSLLLYSQEPQINLMVSDIRETSLQNLTTRFASAGIRNYQRKVLDLTQNNEQLLHHYAFDGILFDAPCSGAGTWGRTPEMLSAFDEAKIQQYAKLQKRMSHGVVKYLKPGKPLIYMTCSVFKEENEEVVDYLLSNFPLSLEKMELIQGTADQADTMFVARLLKN